jgi:hypothetical protein
MPPVASTTALAGKTMGRPVVRQYPNAPVTPSRPVISSVIVHSM